MLKRPLTIALVAISVPLFGGIAYAATQSVASQPSPQVVIPTATTADDHGGARSTGGTDDPANHDATDDKGGLVTATPATSDDNPATHDVGDDKGGLSSADVSDDNPATHDVGDDNGGSITSTPTTGNDNPATHDVGDDKGGSSGSGSSGSGSGKGGGGTDDPAGHN